MKTFKGFCVVMILFATAIVYQSANMDKSGAELALEQQPQSNEAPVRIKAKPHKKRILKKKHQIRIGGMKFADAGYKVNPGMNQAILPRR